jgi:hypothetical protein
VQRTAEKVVISLYPQPSASRTSIFLALIPAVNCWATISRPLMRTDRSSLIQLLPKQQLSKHEAPAFYAGYRFAFDDDWNLFHDR